jgi:triacylglycerol lipase
MPLAPKPIPTPEIDHLVPPDVARAYFDFSGDVPFEPHSSDFSLVNAVWLMEASFAAYSDANRRANLSQLGPQWQATFKEEENTRCLVLEGPEAILLAFRGTRVEGFIDPITRFRFVNTNLQDMITNFDFLPVDLGSSRKVHRGFLNAMGRVYDDVERVVEQSLRGAPGRKIWCTGHSLGAALATLAADRLHTKIPVQGLYTFGSPRVGNEEFCATFPVANVCRFVDHLDLVPKVPPKPTYEHLGRLKYLTRDGRLQDTEEQHGFFDQLQDGFAFVRQTVDVGLRKSRIKDMTTWPVPVESLVDHAPVYYANKIWNLLVTARNG